MGIKKKIINNQESHTKALYYKIYRKTGAQYIIVSDIMLNHGI